MSRLCTDCEKPIEASQPADINVCLECDDDMVECPGCNEFYPSDEVVYGPEETDQYCAGCLSEVRFEEEHQRQMRADYRASVL